MSSIFNIKGNYQFLLSQIDRETGEMSEEVSQQLTCTEEDAKDHAEQLVLMKKELDGDLLVIADEMDRLSTLKIRKEKAITALKDALKWVLENFGEVGRSGNRTLKIGTHSIFTTNREVIKIEDDFDNDLFIVYSTKDVFSKDEILTLVQEDKISNESVISKIKAVDVKEYLLSTTSLHQDIVIGESGYIDPKEPLNSMNELFEDKSMYPKYISKNKIMFKYNDVTDIYVPIASLQPSISVTIK